METLHSWMLLVPSSGALTLQIKVATVSSSEMMAMWFCSMLPVELSGNLEKLPYVKPNRNLVFYCFSFKPFQNHF
jgi:hypothetical protein